MNYQRLAMAGILVALLGAIPAQAQFRIDDTGDTFTILQEALDAVTTGQTISIEGGVYTESGLAMYYKDCITIKARSGSQDVTLSGGTGSGALSAYVCPDLKLENIRFRNSDARPTLTTPPRFGRGGGLLLYLCKGVVITGCDFSNNQAQTGGGIHAEESEVDLFNCTVTNNTATGEGGGMFFDDTPVFVADGLTLNNNTAGGNGGGMWCGNGTYYCMRGSGFIQYNNASGNGGAMYCSDTSTIEIADGQLMWGNTASQGPQGLIEGSGGRAYFQAGGFYDQSRWDGGDHYPEVLEAGFIPIKRITYPAYPEPMSVMMIPDGGGICLSQAYYWNSPSTGDATIKVYGLTYPQDKSQIWLDFTDPTTNITIYPGPHHHPDSNVDPYGRAEFQLPVPGGGYTGPGCKVFVTSMLDDWIHNVDLDIYFNSPDINGDGLVDFADWIRLVGDFWDLGVNDNYNYRSDFNGDGAIDLTDIVTFSSTLCSFFIYPVEPQPCGPCN